MNQLAVDRMSEKAPYIKTRERASTKGCNSPPFAKKTQTYSCPTTGDKRLSKKEERKDWPEAEVHFQNVLSKVAAVQLGRFLDQHGFDCKFRVKMIDWMVEVLAIYRQKESTAFRSIFLLDLFYSRSPAKQSLDDLHLAGITCMFIASKAEEVRYVKLDSLVDVIGRKKFSKSEILAKEQEILKTIDYRASVPCVFELIQSTFRLIQRSSSSLMFERLAVQAAKICLCSYEMVACFSTEDIVLCSLVLAGKLCERFSNGASLVDLNHLAGLFGVGDGQILLKKLELVQNYLVNFRAINPKATNIESLEELATKLI